MANYTNSTETNISAYLSTAGSIDMLEQEEDWILSNTNISLVEIIDFIWIAIV